MLVIMICLNDGYVPCICCSDPFDPHKELRLIALGWSKNKSNCPGHLVSDANKDTVCAVSIRLYVPSCPIRPRDSATYIDPKQHSPRSVPPLLDTPMLVRKYMLSVL